MKKILLFLLVSIMSLGINAQTLYGDVNGDNAVTISDVNCIISDILDGGFNANSDVNDDGQVNISDLNAIINAILDQPIVQLYSTIIVVTTEGTTVEYLIDKRSKIQISDPFLLINTNGMMQVFMLENMAQLRYGQRVVTRGVGIFQDYRPAGVGTVFLNDLKDDTPVQVTSTDGRLLFNERCSGTVEISLSNEPAGEYVVTAGSQTLKIVKP